MQGGTTLYDTLQIPRDATLDQIKKAYKKLALKEHPDKNQNDPSAADRFKQINHAYQILSDANKRSAYDRFGESGVQALDNDFASPFVHAVGGPLTIFAALIFFFLVFASLLMTLAGTTAKLDGANDWTWVHSLFGVWILDVLLGIFTVVHILGFVSSITEKNWSAAVMMFTIASVLVLTITWTALVAVNLDRPSNTTLEMFERPTWITTNSPGIAALVLIFLVGLGILKQSMHLEANAFGLTKFQMMLLAAIRAGSIAMPFVLLVLISKKADDSLRDPSSSFASASWFAILAPCFAFSILRGMSTTFSTFVMTLRGAEGWRAVFCKEVISWMFAHLLFLVGIGLIGEKLQNPDTTTRTWAVTFVPWYIISGFLTLLTCCFSCTFSSAISQMQEMEEQQRRAQEYEQNQQNNNNNSNNVGEDTSAVPTSRNGDVPRPPVVVVGGGIANNDSNGSIDSTSPIILGAGSRTTTGGRGNGNYGSGDEH